MEPVCILCRPHRCNHPLSVNLFREGELDENAVDLRVRVQLPDLLQHILRCRIFGQFDPDRTDPHPFARPVLHAHVHL